jgi:hypothetical protein
MAVRPTTARPDFREVFDRLRRKVPGLTERYFAKLAAAEGVTREKFIADQASAENKTPEQYVHAWEFLWLRAAQAHDADPVGGLDALVAAIEDEDIRHFYPTDLGPYPAQVLAELLGEPATEAPAKWDELQPLDVQEKLPPFPVSVLPSWLAAFASDLSVATQTPVDLAGVLVLAMVSFALSKKVKAQPRPGWREPVNLYGMAVLEVANRKSTVHSYVIAPVQEYERDIRAVACVEIKRVTALLELATERAKVARTRAAKATTPEERAKLGREAAEASAAVDAIVVPAAPEIFCDDVTPEGMVSLLAKQGGRIAAFSAEGGLFANVAGRYGKSGEPNLDGILKSHSGDKITVHRKGSPNISVEEPALTLGLAVQPFVLDGLIHRPGFLGCGLIARIFYAVPVSKVGTREIGAPPVPVEIVESYHDNLIALLNLPAIRDAHGEIVAHMLAFEPDADETLRVFEREVEPRLGAGGDLHHVQDWAGKLVGLVVRFAAILHVADTDQIGRPFSPIPARAVARAVELGRYALAHALSAYARMGADVATNNAGIVLAWIRRRGAAEFTAHDAGQGVKGTIKNQEPVNVALSDLAERGFVRLAPGKPHPGPGRKPSPSYQVNPATLQGTQGEQGTQDGFRDAF